MSSKNKNKNKGKAVTPPTIPTKQLGGEGIAEVIGKVDATDEGTSVSGQTLTPFGSTDAPVVETVVETVERATTDDSGSTIEERIEKAKTQNYRVKCDFNTPVKIEEGVFAATSEDDAKKQFFAAAGVLSTTRPIKVSVTEDEPGDEDLSDLF